MAEETKARYKATAGSKRMLMMRLADERHKEAFMLPFETTHGWAVDVSVDTTITKDGGVPSSGGGATEKITFEALSARPDSQDAPPTDKILYYASVNGALVEVWDIDFSQAGKPGTVKGTLLYPAKYATMYISSGESTDPAEGNSTISYEGTTENVAFHDVTITAKNEAVKNKYFYDVTADSAEVTAGLDVYTPEIKKP